MSRGGPRLCIERRQSRSQLRSTTVSSITYNNLALSPLSSVLSNDVRTELWYRKNPPSGAYSVIVTIGANRMVAAGAMTFSGVHQTTTF